MKKKQQSSAKFAVILTVIVVVLLAGIVLINNSTQQSSETVSSQPSIKGQPVLGKNDAPVTVVEFGDYKCPSCKVFNNDIFPKIQKDFIDKGDVKFSFVNVMFHGKGSRLAALASEEVWKEDPDSFWSFHEKLFEEQPNTEQEWVTPVLLGNVAKSTTKVNPATLKENLDKETFSSEVEKDSELNNKLNIQATPTIYVNDKVIENFADYGEIKKAIEKELKGKQ
ncbi:DsbA family protein [Bacillus atrophaeus]|uniref:DsbA family protein n=1 Tax=Bacillus atrophaeus TaxID=1452 RepID=UPI00077A385E|nr:DsbA family protein [Bacillus atrophaeus]KXZ19703.1 dihydroneopterin aldolase [Bacillus atrophaeus]MCY8835884.1 DsbA family protein [Bacillus atrophaeus]MED4807629.1 DsbA family protein [Bacillus atrophaeus]GED01859.1 disulfide bond formation protein D [Bacillus atrophaeus]